MSKNQMFDPSFDPYNELILINQKLDRLERAHNNLARDYIKSQNDLSILMDSHQHLQKAHLAMSKLIGTGLVKGLTDKT